MTTQASRDDSPKPAKTKALIGMFVAAAMVAGCASGGSAVQTGGTAVQSGGPNPYAGEDNVCWDENEDGYCDDDGSEIDRNYYYMAGGYPYYGRLPGTAGRGGVYSGGVTNGKKPPTLTPQTPRSPSAAPAPGTTNRSGTFSSKPSGSSGSSSGTSGSISSGSAPKGGIGSSSGSFGG